MPIAVSRRQPKRSLLSDTRPHTSRFGGGYFLKYVEHPVAVTLSIASRLSAAQGRSVFGRIATGYIACSSTPNEEEIFLTTSASDVLPSNVKQRDVTVRLRWSNNEQLLSLLVAACFTSVFKKQQLLRIFCPRCNNTRRFSQQTRDQRQKVAGCWFGGDES